ncbi:TLC domain-containing protein [Mucidula mucida]|nr:TLC domain-containing protein [Mucidula mucida]
MEALLDAARYFGLEQLPPNIPNVLASFAFFTGVHLIVAPLLSGLFFKETYGKMDRRGRNNWCIHIVSQVHVLVIIPLALRAMAVKELADDKAFGWSDRRIGLMTSVASGYFLWDSLDAIVNFSDIGFVIHGYLTGVACFTIYMGSFRPFVAYFTARCLLWELSTFFLNIHWFLDKTNRTGSKLQLFNGIFLILSFFVVRIVYGGMYITPRFSSVLWSVRDQIPMAYRFVFLGGNTCLQCLNILWFSKMIQAIKKRFPMDKPKRKLPVVVSSLPELSGQEQNMEARFIRKPPGYHAYIGYSVTLSSLRSITTMFVRIYVIFATI